MPLAQDSDHFMRQPLGACLSETLGLLCGMTVGTASSTQVATINFAPAVERLNKTPNYV